MSPDAKAVKVASLLAESNEQHQEGRSQAALQRLREAISLDPDNDEVKQAFSRLQTSSEESPAIQTLHQYVALKTDDALRRLRETLAEKETMSAADAAQCLDTALEHDYSQAPWADIIHQLVSGQSQVRKIVAQRVSSKPRSIFELLLATSDTTSKVVFQVLFDVAVWPSSETQTSAQRAIFQECIPRQQGGNRSTDLMLRQLILSPTTVADMCDEEVFSQLFALLDIRNPQQSRGQALLATTKLFEAREEAAEAVFVRLTTRYATSVGEKDSIIAFSAAAALFPVIPAICARLLLTEGFVQALVPLLQRHKISEIDHDSTTTQKAVLELLSAACIDKACREAIVRHCQTRLESLSSEGPQQVRALAALVLAKVSGNTAEPGLARTLSTLTLQDSQESNLAVEGLAYASLKPAIKEQISTDAVLLRRIIASVGQRNTLSCLTILANLTAYRPAHSEEQKKMAQLKAYANSSKPTPEDPLDNNAVVSKRCKTVLEAGVVCTLVACFKDLITVTNLNLTSKIVSSLARESKHRTRMAQEGGVKLLLQMSARLHTLQHKDSIPVQRVAAHALARVLISVNPEHVFNATIAATSAASAMIPLLEVGQEQDKRDLLPTFEALLALTNLASMSDGTVAELVIRKGWTVLEDQLLLSTNVLIQRASVELVCNLMLSPAGVAKFADGSDQASRRLHILLALADVEDFATRRAAGGALAMLTEWDTAVVAITKISRGIKILLSMCADGHDEIKHRGMICTLNCVSIPGEAGATALAKVKAEDGKAKIREALKSANSADVLAAGVDLLKKLT